jgi:SPP1 gp7 family putative phage head morphogenesis protein
LRGLKGLTQEALEFELSELYSCHEPCTHEHHLNDLADDGADIEEMMNWMVMNIWKAKGMPSQIDADVTQYYASQLMKGVSQGYGESLMTVDFETPDFLMLRKLEENVFHFSAAKNFTQLRQLSQALLNEKGQLRTYNEFKEAAHEINQDHVGRWLKAEYEQAVGASQMAATWTKIKEDEKELPLLKFDAVNDDRTTPVCHDLDGVTRPINDTFWQIYYPPNHWGCRSDVQQLANGKITPTENIITPEKMPTIFKTNLAANGLVFPEGHPYYIGNSSQVREQAMKVMKGKDIKPEKAKTIKEAEDFALQNGLAKKVSFKGLKHVDVANDVNEVLMELKREGVTYDEILTTKSTSKGRPSYIMQNKWSFVWGKGADKWDVSKENWALHINLSHFNRFETYADINAFFVKQREAMWTTGENVKHTVWHEVGHRLTTKKVHQNDEGKGDAHGSKVYDFERLGRYAVVNLKETLAEIYSYYKKTGSLPEDWKQKFNRWSIIPIK